MDTFDLETAFYKKLAALAFNGRTVKPYEEFDPKNAEAWRRGTVVVGQPEPVGFGNGVYSRVEGIYQIDLYVPHKSDNALRTVQRGSDAHVTHFFPVNGRGLSLIEEQTMAVITRRPAQRSPQREGAYLRAIVEIDFYVDIPAVG